MRKAPVDWQEARDIKLRVDKLVDELSLEWINKNNVTCFRSENTTTRAYARIWGLPRIWQLALHHEPYYVIEVIAERFDKQDEDRQDEILLHELCHIPRNFSGALVPHTRRGKGSFHERLHEMVSMYRDNRKKR